MTYPTKDHHRVSPTGQHMGRNAARLAALGQARLKAAGLENHNVPAVRRWDSPLWSQQGHTGDFIARLRAALAKFGSGA